MNKGFHLTPYGLTPYARYSMNGYKGFTLIEVIVILAVIAILAGMAIPTALRIFQTTAENTTRDELDNLKKAMLGDPQKLQSSFRSDFGFLGDIGCLPDDLRRIFRNDSPPLAASLPLWMFDSTTKQAGAGWKGPYITGPAGEEFTKDQWGNDYVYTATGCPLTATLKSNGPDGLPSTADDLIQDIVPNETTATIRGTVKNVSGVPLSSVPVELYYPSNGTLTTSLPATTDANGNYSIPGVPFGHRAVKPNPASTLTFIPSSVTVTGGSNNDVNFQVANYSANPITVTHITVNCTGTGAVRYDDIRINGGADLTSSNNIACSPTPTQANTTDQTILQNPTPPGPLRVFVDSPDTQLPDLVLRDGSIVTFTIETFETSGGAAVDMRGGKTIAVTFYSSVATVISTVTVVTP